MSGLDRVPRFDPAPLLERAGVTTFVGASHSGKSIACGALIREAFLDFVDIWFVFSENSSTAESWRRFFEKQHHKVVVLTDIEQIFNVGELSKRRLKSEGDRPIRSALVLDDILGSCTGQKELKYKKSLLQFILYSGRHYNLWSFILVQDVCGLSRAAFSSAYCNFVFFERSLQTFEAHLYPKILDTVAEQIPGLERMRSKTGKVMQARKLMQQLRPYEALVVSVDDATNRGVLSKYLA